MSDIAQLEQRITSALDRIRRGIENLPAQSVAQSVARSGAQSRDGTTTDEAPPATAATEAQVAELTARLDEEKTANAQLEERVRLLKQRQDGKLAELESNVDAGRTRATRMDRELQRLRQVNAELRDINSQLREAVSAGISEPHLVNKAMLAELEALRATRASDAAEMDMILDELTPILEKEAGHGAG